MSTLEISGAVIDAYCEWSEATICAMGDRGAYGVVENDRWLGVYNHNDMYLDDPQGGIWLLLEDIADICDIPGGWGEFVHKLKNEITWASDIDSTAYDRWHRASYDLDKSGATRYPALDSPAPFSRESYESMFEAGSSHDLSDREPNFLLRHATFTDLLDLAGSGVVTAEETPFRAELAGTDFNYVLAVDLDHDQVCVIKPASGSGRLVPGSTVVACYGLRAESLRSAVGIARTHGADKAVALFEDPVFDPGSETLNANDLKRPEGMPGIGVVKEAVSGSDELWSNAVRKKQAEERLAELELERRELTEQIRTL